MLLFSFLWSGWKSIRAYTYSVKFGPNVPALAYECLAWSP